MEFGTEKCAMLKMKSRKRERREGIKLSDPSQEMDTAILVQISDETDCISHSTNTLGKGMNPIILPPVMGK